MGFRFRQPAACLAALAVCSTSWAASQLAFQVPFIFGSVELTQEEPGAYIDSGAAFSIGGGMFFSRNIGVFGSVYRSPSGVTVSGSSETGDPNIGSLTLDYDFKSIFAANFGVILRRDISKTVYAFSRIGVMYARQGVEVNAETSVPVPIVVFTDDSTAEATGGMAVGGVGVALRSDLDLTFSFTARSADLEADDAWLDGFKGGTAPGYSVGLLMKF